MGIRVKLLFIPFDVCASPCISSSICTKPHGQQHMAIWPVFHRDSSSTPASCTTRRRSQHVVGHTSNGYTMHAMAAPILLIVSSSASSSTSSSESQRKRPTCRLRAMAPAKHGASTSVTAAAAAAVLSKSLAPYSRCSRCRTVFIGTHGKKSAQAYLCRLRHSNSGNIHVRIAGGSQPSSMLRRCEALCTCLPCVISLLLAEMNKHIYHVHNAMAQQASRHRKTAYGYSGAFHWLDGPIHKTHECKQTLNHIRHNATRVIAAGVECGRHSRCPQSQHKPCHEAFRCPIALVFFT